MFRAQITPLLLIFGTVALLGGLPTIADALAAVSPMGDYNQSVSPAPEAKDDHRYGGVDKDAAVDSAIPLPVQAGAVTYLTGGVGDDERDALNAVRNDYNLRVLNVTKAGAYIGDTHIVVRNRQSEILNLTAGPIFLAKLPPGSYTLTADSEGQSKTERVRIKDAQPASLHFSWN